MAEISLQPLRLPQSDDVYSGRSLPRGFREWVHDHLPLKAHCSRTTGEVIAGAAAELSETSVRISGSPEFSLQFKYARLGTLERFDGIDNLRIAIKTVAMTPHCARQSAKETDGNIATGLKTLSDSTVLLKREDARKAIETVRDLANHLECDLVWGSAGAHYITNSLFQRYPCRRIDHVTGINNFGVFEGDRERFVTFSFMLIPKGMEATYSLHNALEIRAFWSSKLEEKAAVERIRSASTTLGELNASATQYYEGLVAAEKKRLSDLDTMRRELAERACEKIRALPDLEQQLGPWRHASNGDDIEFALDYAPLSERGAAKFLYKGSTVESVGRELEHNIRTEIEDGAISKVRVRADFTISSFEMGLIDHEEIDYGSRSRKIRMRLFIPAGEIVALEPSQIADLIRRIGDQSEKFSLAN